MKVFSYESIIKALFVDKYHIAADTRPTIGECIGKITEMFHHLDSLVSKDKALFSQPLLQKVSLAFVLNLNNAYLSSPQ